MSRGKDKDWAATKKKPPKPRSPPVVALTDAEREEKAAEALRKAVVHLTEAEAMVAWGGAPNACIHAAYYAMHFIAVAALLRAGGVGKRGSVPDSHEHVLQHYIALSEGQGAALRDTGRALNRARDRRVQSDYFPEGGLDGVQSATQAEATEIAADARALLEAWRAHWDARSSRPSRSPSRSDPNRH